MYDCLFWCVVDMNDFWFVVDEEMLLMLIRMCLFLVKVFNLGGCIFIVKVVKEFVKRCY